MISFILSSRNDGYGGKYKNYNTTMRRLQMSIDSIKLLGLEEYEILIVEWCPVVGMNPISKEITASKEMNLNIITVPKESNDLLKLECQKTIPFYEYIAKHIGIIKSKYEIICVVNPDNIFVKNKFDDCIELSKKGHYVRATRYDIPIEVLDLSSEDVVCRILDFTKTGKFNTAGGDFSMMLKRNYFEAGGYRLCNGNWDVDNEFQRRVKNKMPITYSYEHYHIKHDFSLVQEPGRPKGNASNYFEFSNQVIDKIVKIVSVEKF